MWGQQESRPRILPEGVEGHRGSAISQTFYSGLDGCRTIQLFCAVGDIERVQALDVLGGAAGLRFCEDVDRATGAAHNGRTDDADVWLDVYGLDIEIRPPSLARSEQRPTPEVSRGWVLAVRVEGIDVILRGGDDQDIVKFSVAHLVLAEVERLRIDVADDGKTKYLAEVRGVHIRRREDGLRRLDPRPRVVVVPGGYVLRAYHVCACQEGNEEEGA